MPPRRSCFLNGIQITPETPSFQCHHGVPACWKEAGMPRPFLSFNATTAFLLQQLGESMERRRQQFQFHHRVPAST